MSELSRKIWPVTAATVVAFAIYETIKTLLFPRLSIVGSHVITVAVVGVLAFFLSRYALGRHGVVLSKVQRQTRFIEESYQLLSAVLAGLREGVLMVDSQTNIVLYNNAVIEMLALKQHEYADPSVSAALRDTGKPLHSYLISGASDGAGASDNSGIAGRGKRLRLADATRNPAVNEAFRKALAEHAPVETRVELVGRSTRIVQLNVAPIADGQAVGVFYDLTELERLEGIRREFLYNLSHELHTPLLAILALSQTSAAGGIADPHNTIRFLERLHKNALRMSDLLQDISALASIESGDVNLSPEFIRLKSAVAEAVVLRD